MYFDKTLGIKKSIKQYTKAINCVHQLSPPNNQSPKTVQSLKLFPTHIVSSPLLSSPLLGFQNLYRVFELSLLLFDFLILIKSLHVFLVFFFVLCSCYCSMIFACSFIFTTSLLLLMFFF